MVALGRAIGVNAGRGSLLVSKWQFGRNKFKFQEGRENVRPSPALLGPGRVTKPGPAMASLGLR